MAQYAHIVDGVLLSIGELPLYARRLDTNELLGPGQVRERLEATGYYPVTVDPARITDDPVKREALREALTSAWQQRQNRIAIGNMSVTANSDWIEAYGLQGGQFPNAGLQWPTGGTVSVLIDRVNILRQGVNLALRELNLVIPVLIDMLADRGATEV